MLNFQTLIMAMDGTIVQEYRTRKQIQWCRQYEKRGRSELRGPRCRVSSLVVQVLPLYVPNRLWRLRRLVWQAYDKGQRYTAPASGTRSDAREHSLPVKTPMRHVVCNTEIPSSHPWHRHTQQTRFLSISARCQCEFALCYHSARRGHTSLHQWSGNSSF